MLGPVAVVAWASESFPALGWALVAILAWCAATKLDRRRAVEGLELTIWELSQEGGGR